MHHKHNNPQDEWREEVFQGGVGFKDAGVTAPATVSVLPEWLANDAIGRATFNLADATVLVFGRPCAVFYDNIHCEWYIRVLVYLSHALGAVSDFVCDRICSFSVCAVLHLRTNK